MNPTGPADPDPPPPRRRMFGWIFWAALGFGVVCVGLGALVGLEGPRLFPKPAVAAPAPTVLATAASPGQSPLPANFSSAPSRAQIADDFTGAASQALAASKDQARSPGAPAMTEPDAVLARAKKAVAEGKLETAVCDIASLPPAGQKAMTSWRESVERRIAAEQHAHGPGVAAARIVTRLVLGLIALAAAAAAGFVLAEHPGHASLAWGGWRIETSAAALGAGGFVASLLLAAVWAALAWLMGLPARGAHNRDETARRKAHDAIARGYLALASGDADEADRQAGRAAASDGEPLAYLLAGQAAEARGDDGAAQAAYAHLLDDPAGRPAGQRALRRLALRRGDDLAQVAPIPPEAPLSVGD